MYIECMIEENPHLTEEQFLMCEESKRAFFVQLKCERVITVENRPKEIYKNEVTKIFPYWLDLSFICEAVRNILKRGGRNGRSTFEKLVNI